MNELHIVAAPVKTHAPLPYLVQFPKTATNPEVEVEIQAVSPSHAMRMAQNVFGGEVPTGARLK